MPIVEKVPGVIEAEAQGTDAKGVMHAKQIVGFVEPNRFGNRPCPLFTLQTAAHKQAPPAVGAGVCKDTECLIALRRMLSAFVEPRRGSRYRLAVIGEASASASNSNSMTSRPAPRCACSTPSRSGAAKPSQSE